MAAFLADVASRCHPILAGRLTWWPELGLGYYPVDPIDEPYNQAYFDKYAAYAQTPLGDALNQTRGRMVERSWRGDVVDVGVGSGSFITHRGAGTWGYDVNPAGLRWLHENNCYWSPYVDPCDAVTLWDVMEHIADFPALLANVRRFCFVAMPIFADVEQVLRSKHFRRDEHFWYFTRAGLIEVMADLGWQCLEVNQNESVLGRDHVESFTFMRTGTTLVSRTDPC